MGKTFNPTSMVVVLLMLTVKVSIVTSKETCNYVKWMICEKGMSEKVKLPKYVRVENFLCDTETDGGGWIIFQRRFNQDTSFMRNWEEYRKGFGSKCNDHWIGNEYLHIATKWGFYELRIDMVFQKKPYYAQYSNFTIGNEDDNYRLTATGFTGNVTRNDLEHHSGHQFSTFDVDNSARGLNCGQNYMAGWWYHGCVTVNLNGEFGHLARGVNWPALTDKHRSLSAVEMKLRLKK